MAKLTEHHGIFPKRVTNTWKQISIVLRNINVGYLKRRIKRPAAHVKHQIFSVACPPNDTMKFTRRKVSKITEE